MSGIEKILHVKIRVLLCVLALAGFFATSASAKGEVGDWKWKAEASLGLYYDTNVYKLSSLQKDRFDLNLSKDQTTGRFKDMDSIDDFIFTPRLMATLRRRGYDGGALTLKPSIAYNRYVQNQEKSYFDFGLNVHQALGKHSGVGVDLGYAPNIFKKNYLSGAVDNEPLGDPAHGITGSEKSFSPAHYDKTDLTFYYSQRLWKSARKNFDTLSLEAVSGKVFAGYENKNYDDPFTNRTEDSLFAGFDVALALYRHTTLTLGYLYKDISTPVEPETLVRNELSFNIDFDNDSVIENLNVATRQNVDRSRTQNTIGVKVTRKLQKDWTGYIKYNVRFTSFKSKEPFDVVRVDRNDTRQRFGLGLKGEVAPSWTMALGWTVTHNSASRSALAQVDKTEGKSYDKNVLSVVVSHVF